MKKPSLLMAMAALATAGGSCWVDAQAGLNDIVARPASVIQRSAYQPEGHLYGVVPRYVGAVSYSDAFYGSINVADGTVTPLKHSNLFSNGEDYETQGGAVRDGILYIPQFVQNMVTSEVKILWKRFNVETFEELSPLDFGSNMDAFCYSLTYDPVRDRFLGLSMNQVTEVMGYLVEIDCSQEQWKIENLGTLGGVQKNFMACISYCPADDQIYGLKDNGNMYVIDVDWCDATVVKTFDEDNEGFMIPLFPYPSTFVYSPRDRSFVTVYRDNEEQRMVLGYLDIDTMEAVEGEELSPICYVSSLYCSDPYAPPAAPDIIPDPVFEFDAAAFDGTVSLTAPAVTYAGDPITGTVMLTAELDGAEWVKEELQPGETRVYPISTTEGEHHMALSAIVTGGADRSPITEKSFYVGNDSPVAPASLKWVNHTLSWTPSSGEGEHDGYVEPGSVKYNVYVDGVLCNSEPVSNCSYAIELPATPKRVDIHVTSVSNKMESQPSAVLSEVIGHGYALPVSLQPTAEEAQMFSALNVNGDENEWKFTTDGDITCFQIRTGYYYQRPDDWLFLPPMQFNSAESQYELLMTYVNGFLSPDYFDDLEIWIGTGATPGEMVRKVYWHDHRKTSVPEPLKAIFAVPSAGDYVIGIHATEGDVDKYRGVRLYGFNVSEVEGGSSKAPGDALVEMKAADNGVRKVNVHLTAPTLDMNGNLLDNEPVTLTVACGENSVSTQALPGAETDVEIPVEVDGYSFVSVTPSNANGAGAPRTTRLYVGLDTPMPVLNLKGMASNDNLSYNITWEAPTEGVNGGYVDPSALQYEILIQGSANQNTLIDSTSDLSYTYDFGNRAQEMPFLGVRAVNANGERSSLYFVCDYIGTPNELPMIEEFGNTAFSYTWKNDTSHKLEWMSKSDLNGYGVGNPVFIEGGMKCGVEDSGGESGKLIATKFTTVGCPTARMELVYWDYPQAGDMVLTIRTAAKPDEVELARLKPEHSAGEWKRWIVSLPDDALEQPWVQVNVIALIEGDSMCILDSYNVTMDVEYDFKISSVSAPYAAHVGEDNTFKVIATNSGQEPNNSSVLVELLSDGNVVDSQSFTIGRTAPGNSYERQMTFSMKAEYAGSMMELRASITGDSDEIEANNVRTVPFYLYDNVIPMVDDLSAAWNDDHTGVKLSWSAPDTQYGGFESFEALPAFEISDCIGDWKNVDIDGLPQFPISGKRWDGDDLPSGWVIFDAKKMDTMDNDRLSPRSGSQMLLARCVQYDEQNEDPIQSSDWLISPEVIGGTVVDFWMNTISSGYSETVAIYYSTTDDNIKSFVKGRNFTKSGTETWEHLTYRLPADAKYFAFVFESWGTFAAMIDDITFTPANSLNWDIKSYDVVRLMGNRVQTIAQGVTDLSYVDNGNTDRSATYYVVVNAERKDGIYSSPFSNAASVVTTGVDGVNADGVIGAGRGFIFVGGHVGDRVEVFTLDGKRVAAVAAASDRETISLRPGVYTVVAGSSAAKVIVK